MHSVEAFLGLLFAALGTALVARRLNFPYPIALLLGGLLLALIPGVPRFRMDPSAVLYILLPPILAEAAYFTSWRDFLRWKRAILLLAFGLVTATSAMVAAICVALMPGLNWATGFALGAIISPPDAAAATSITRGLHLPRRIVQILEGESLVNDAAGLTVYRFAVAAIVTGAFSMQHALLDFAWIALGGTLIGVASGLIFVKLYPKLRDVDVEVISTFLLAYAPYFLAEAFHASGVLATVAAAMILGWKAPEMFTATARIRAHAVWSSVVFLINVVIFFLIGLQLPDVIEGVHGYPTELLVTVCAAVVLGAIVLRLLWVFIGAYLPRRLSATIRATEPAPGLPSVVVVGWTGLRGVVSLAAALALPLETERGLPFPYRSFILFVTFVVILATLLVQGLTLRPLICWLKVPQDKSSEEEQLRARVTATEKALDRLTEIETKGGMPPSMLERVRGYFEDRLATFRAELEAEEGVSVLEDPNAFQSIAEQRVWWELVRVERETVIAMRRKGEIGEEALHQIQNDIDLLEARLVPKGAKA